MAARGTSCEGAVVAELGEGSPLAGIVEPGDLIVSINRKKPRDLMDFLFLQGESRLALRIMKADGTKKSVLIRKRPEESLRVTFQEPVFDSVRRCGNACFFCFVDQLPPGLRSGLYLKDDDYRLSVLQGNFITMNNLDRKDLKRILDLRLQPLYVSLHSTDPEARDRIMGGRMSRRALRMLEEVISSGLEVHLQVVLCPGINDGTALEATLRDCLDRYPAESLGVVPVSLRDTDRGPRGTRPLGRADAENALSVIQRYQQESLGVLGRRFCFASDEIYLSAGVEFPREEEYEGYPQLENGIGMARRFIDGASRALEEDGIPRMDGPPIALVTGVLGAKVLEEALAPIMREEADGLRILPVENRVFGPGVTVSGLLGGGEVGDALAALRGCRTALVPSNALSEGVFIDGTVLREVEEGLGIALCPVETGGDDLVRELRRLCEEGV
jgi:putative radical SAM enzyme (TIGR03279 family)